MVRVPVSETLFPPWLIGVEAGVGVGLALALVFCVSRLEVDDVDRDARSVLLVCDSGVWLDSGVEVGVVGVDVDVGVVDVGVVDVEVSDVQGAKSVEMGTVKICCSPEMVTGT